MSGGVGAGGGGGGGGGGGACSACLSAGRELRGLRALAPLYGALLQAQNAWTSESLSVCWECTALLRKVIEFKRRAHYAQQVLGDRFANINNFASTSTLDVSTARNTFDFTFVHQEVEPELHVPIDTSQVKLEKIIKEEVSGVGEIEVELQLTSEGFEDCAVAGGSSELERAKVNKEEVPETSSMDTQIIENVPKVDFVDHLPKRYEMVRVSHDEMLKNREASKSKGIYVRAQYKCDSCVLAFRTAENLVAHNECHEPGEHLSACDICHVTILPWLVDKHREAHYVNYKCVKCTYTTISRKCVQRHYVIHNVRGTWKCEDCDELFDSVRKLSYHKDTKHDGPVECDYCQKKFTFKQSLLKHIQNLHIGCVPRMPCPVCKKLYSNHATLRVHMRCVHAESDEVHRCADCDKTFKNKQHLAVHLKYSQAHAGGDDRCNKRKRKYECTECDKKFHSSLELQQHVDFRHLGKKSYKCIICGKWFASHASMSSHTRRLHTGRAAPGNHACEECGMPFKTKEILAVHKSVHKGERPYKCDACGEAFTQQAALDIHNRNKHPEQNSDEETTSQAKKKQKRKRIRNSKQV